MPYCATNKFASTKRKLPRDLVISSEAQASAEVAMAKRIRFDCSFPAILNCFPIHLIGFEWLLRERAASQADVTAGHAHQSQRCRRFAAAIHSHWQVQRRQHSGPHQDCQVEFV